VQFGQYARRNASATQFRAVALAGAGGAFGLRVVLLADHRVWLETEPRVELPITAASLITEITRFALDLAPYLELMDEAGLTLSGVR
jgi:hypothetical protein